MYDTSADSGQYGPGGIGQGSYGYGPRAAGLPNAASIRQGPGMRPRISQGQTARFQENEGPSSEKKLGFDRDNGWPSESNLGRNVPSKEPKGQMSVPHTMNRPTDMQFRPADINPGIGRKPGNTVQNHESRWSNDMIDYKKFILFVSPGNAVCKRAQQMVSDLNEVYVMNINNLPATKRPRWLIGVPTLYSRQDNEPYTGSYCFEVLKILSNDALKGPTNTSGSTMMKLHQGDIEEPQSYSMAGCSSGGVYVPDVDDERRYATSKIKGEDELQRYQTMRSQSGKVRPLGESVHAPGGIDDMF